MSLVDQAENIMSGVCRHCGVAPGDVHRDECPEYLKIRIEVLESQINMLVTDMVKFRTLLGGLDTLKYKTQNLEYLHTNTADYYRQFNEILSRIT